MKRYHHLFLVGSALLATLTQAARADLPAVFQEELDAVRLAFGFPGATAAYVLPDGSVGTAATGWADVEAARPMTPSSRMPSASIGKMYLGALAAMLAGTGDLDLDVPVATVLTNRAWLVRLPNHERITLRHLLHHTSGLGDHVYTASFAEDVARYWSEPENRFTPETLLAYLFDSPPLFAPGTAWAYSDTGYILAGLMVEERMQRTCYELIQQHFLHPFGLRDTLPADRRVWDGLAAGYTVPDNRLGLPAKTTDEAGALHWHPGLEWMGGGWISTSSDLARWGHVLFAGDALGTDALEAFLHTVPVDATSDAVRYGLGVAVHRNGPHGPTRGHGGWIPGYSSSLRHYPAHAVTVAFQINTDINTGEMVSTIERRLADVVIAHVPANTAEDR